MIIIKKDEWNDRQHEANGAADIVLFNPGDPWGEHYIVLFPREKEHIMHQYVCKIMPDCANELHTAWITGTPIDIVAELVNPDEPDEVVKYNIGARLKILFTGKVD